jgi:excisionase family DNA binding protein
MPLPNVLTEAEAANALRLHPRTLRKARQVGALTYIRIGRSIRYTTADLSAFLAAATVANDVLDRPVRKSQAVSRKSSEIVPFSQRQH